MEHFEDRERKYLAWIQRNPRGFVVNAERSARPDNPFLHRSSCRTINGTGYRNHTTNDYIKLCSGDVAELKHWARSSVGGDLRHCGLCKL